MIRKVSQDQSVYHQLMISRYQCLPLIKKYKYMLLPLEKVRPKRCLYYKYEDSRKGVLLKGVFD